MSASTSEVIVPPHIKVQVLPYMGKSEKLKKEEQAKLKYKSWHEATTGTRHIKAFIPAEADDYER